MKGLVLGVWELVIDERSRLSIPSEIHEYFGEFAILWEGNDRTIHLDSFPVDAKRLESVNPASARIVKVTTETRSSRSGHYTIRRITIPEQLRNTASFYFGGRVELVGKRTHLEIWPRK